MAPRVTQVRASPGKATEGPDGGTWEAGERVRRQVGTTLSSIVWSIREQAHGSGNRAESALRAVGGHRRSPSWLVGARIHGFGRAGGHRGGRRKPVHGGLAAASMPRTPPRCPPARPLTGSCAASHGRQNKKSKAKAKAGRFAPIHAMRGWIYQISRQIQGQSPLRSNGIRPRAVPADRGNLSEAGRWGPAGPLAPWMAPSSPHGWVYGVSCWPPPPRQPTKCPPLLWLLLGPLPLPQLRRVPGAARPKPFPRFRYNVGPVSQLRFPGHDGPRGRARPVAVPPRTS